MSFLEDEGTMLSQRHSTAVAIKVISSAPIQYLSMWHESMVPNLIWLVVILYISA